MYCVVLKNIYFFLPSTQEDEDPPDGDIIDEKQERRGVKADGQDGPKSEYWATESNKNCFDWAQKAFFVCFKIFQVVP